MVFKSYQGNQDYSGNQKNVIKGQRSDMENRHTQQRTYRKLKSYIQSNKGFLMLISEHDVHIVYLDTHIQFLVEIPHTL